MAEKVLNINGYSPLQLSCILIGVCSAVGYYSYTKRWAKSKAFSNGNTTKS